MASKTSDKAIIESYQRTRSVWKAGEELGISGQTVHDRLKKLGVEMNGNGNHWTVEAEIRLANEYEVYRYFGKVSQLGKELGHNVYTLSRKAKELGLTSYAYRKCPRARLSGLSDDALRLFWEDYKASKLNMAEYCRHHGLDDEAFAKIMRDRFFQEYDDVREAKLSKGTRYTSGRTFEYRVKRHLEDIGFFVMRAPQSKGPADLIAYDHGMCLLVQCKMNDWHEVDPWNEFYRIAIKHRAVPIYATKRENGRLALYMITGEKDRSRRAMPMVEYDAGRFHAVNTDGGTP